MEKALKKMINEEFNRIYESKKRGKNIRSLVEGYVREALMERMLQEAKKNKKLSQVQQSLSNPIVNKSALARKISGLSSDDDTRRSEISKIARGEWEPSDEIQTDILHILSTDD